MAWEYDNINYTFVPLIANVELTYSTASIRHCFRVLGFSSIPTVHDHIKFKYFQHKLRLHVTWSTLLSPQ